jgi:plastocyanin
MALVALVISMTGGGNASASTAQASAAKTVSIKGFAFHAPSLTVRAGTKVTFHNADSVAHTATRGGAFNTGSIPPGMSKAVRFAKKGTFAYHCTIHPDMRGKIIVK